MEREEDGVLMKKIWLHIISGRKKKILVMVSCILFMELLGCHHYESRGEYLTKVAREEDEQSDEMMQSIVDALEAQDSNALKKLFSPYALKNAENLDEKIEELMNFYPGSNEGIEGDCISERKANYGNITLILTGDYTVTNDGKEYEVSFITIPQNDEEPEKEGLYLLEVMTEEAKPEGFKWRNEDDEPGIYVLEPQERHW